MSSESYDKSSIKSIALYAQSLIGKSLSEVVNLPSSVLNLEDTKNKGNLGKLIEKYYFRHEPPNDDAPDFSEAELELKVTGVVADTQGKGIQNVRAKERLVLKNIHFGKIQSESWEKSAIKIKCQKMLLLFYLYEKDIPAVHRVFVLEPIVSVFPDVYLDKNELHNSGIFVIEIPEVDVAQMKRDWELIKKKVIDNQAHTISEGDTKYLKACRKGSGGRWEKLQKYRSIEKPEGEQQAPTRAFSLPASYINTLIESRERNISKLGVTSELGFEEATQLRIKPFIGKTTKEISEILKTSFNAQDKALRARLVMTILASGGSSVDELEKAGINVKTVVVDNRLMPKESMSFPAFDYCEIVNQEFEDSDFSENLESTFLFVIFRKLETGEEYLEKAFYWNMPYEDRLEAHEVWRRTKVLVTAGRYEELPKSSENKVAHVRQHARRKSDVSPTPQGGFQVKRSFWLNRRYIGKLVQEVFERDS